MKYNKPLTFYEINDKTKNKLHEIVFIFKIKDNYYFLNQLIHVFLFIVSNRFIYSLSIALCLKQKTNI